MMQNEEFSRICKALSDANRLKIMQMISEQEKCACEILEKFEISQPTMSHHMRILAECNLVHTRREGKWSHYSLNHGTMEEFAGFWEALATIPPGDIKSKTEETTCKGACRP